MLQFVYRQAQRAFHHFSSAKTCLPLRHNHHDQLPHLQLPVLHPLFLPLNPTPQYVETTPFPPLPRQPRPFPHPLIHPQFLHTNLFRNLFCISAPLSSFLLKKQTYLQTPTILHTHNSSNIHPPKPPFRSPTHLKYRADGFRSESAMPGGW
jgi:hypothetical protein